jgi:hypothetical protein
MDYDEYRPATPLDTLLLVPMHVLLGHFDLIPHQWQMMALVE